MVQYTLNGLAVGALLQFAAVARAQWYVTDLHPSQATTTGVEASVATGIWGTEVVGYATVGNYQPSLWYGTRSSWVDLAPSAGGFCAAFGAWNGFQVGVVTPGGPAPGGEFPRATMWAGTPESAIDLHPAGARQSGAFGIHSGQQVGYTVFASQHAALWNGTALSWVDLNPAGATRSIAQGVWNGVQVGFAELGGVSRAALWTGTAQSFVDLTPAAAQSASLLGIWENTQVGEVWINASRHAAMWGGTADSFADLHPSGWDYSFATAAFDGWQVGYVGSLENGHQHAGIWNGTASSWEDLNVMLPAGYTSRAHGVWSDGDYLYIVGVVNGYDGAHAAMWSRPLPSPGAASVLLLLSVGLTRRSRGTGL